MATLVAAAPNADVPENVIIPPPEIRNIVDKTANFVSRNGFQFEEKIREKEKTNPKFSFLQPLDPYYVYYQWKLTYFREGRDLVGSVDGADHAGSATFHGSASTNAADTQKAPPAPVPFEFIQEIPPILRLDYDIVKLTALFTAKNGREFMNQIASKESRNHLFDFLKTSHPLFNFFATLVEQYQRVLAPTVSSTNRILDNSRSKLKVVERVKIRATHIKWNESQKRKSEEERERERAAFSSIDWNDFVIVDSIDITDADFNANLPLPTSLLELQCAALQQRRKALMLSTPGTAADKSRMQADEIARSTIDQTLRAQTSAQIVPQPSSVIPVPDEGSAVYVVPDSTMGPMKIKPVPGGKKKVRVEESTQVCPICSSEVPISEMAEHMRIELLDPRWKEQRAKYESALRDSNINRAGDQVVSSLQKFVEYRKDIFGDEEYDLQRRINEDQEKLKEDSKKMVIWDGHTASIAAATEKVKQIVPLDEQIAAIHKAKGLVPNPDISSLGSQNVQARVSNINKTKAVQPPWMPKSDATELKVQVSIDDKVVEIRKANETTTIQELKELIESQMGAEYPVGKQKIEVSKNQKLVTARYNQKIGQFVDEKGIISLKLSLKP